MKLKTLKPRLQTIGGRVQALKPTRPGTIERKRGSAGVKDRNRIRERDCGLCQQCIQRDKVTVGTVVDHRTPLGAGGSDEDENKWLLCDDCHDVKAEREAARGQEANRSAYGLWGDGRGMTEAEGGVNNFV